MGEVSARFRQGLARRRRIKCKCHQSEGGTFYAFQKDARRGIAVGESCFGGGDSDDAGFDSGVGAQGWRHRDSGRHVLGAAQQLHQHLDGETRGEQRLRDEGCAGHRGGQRYIRRGCAGHGAAGAGGRDEGGLAAGGQFQRQQVPHQGSDSDRQQEPDEVLPRAGRGRFGADRREGIKLRALCSFRRMERLRLFTAVAVLAKNGNSRRIVLYYKEKDAGWTPASFSN